jgi:endonuclease YncB( thermonuclease family)
LTDPFDAQYGALTLSSGLKNYLKSKLGANVAANHHRHAKAAEDALEQEISNDLQELGQTEEEFQFFIAFAGEVMDRYGRLLGYINRYQAAEPRPLDYNGRLLKAGLVSPYLIWPNINPFRKQKSIRQSVPLPGTANNLATQESTLRQAREWVQTARQQKIGIFDTDEPLSLQPFELRFLAQRRAPERWVIDLSKNDNVLIEPQEYYTIPNLEDRLFIPDEFVPLFVETGWKRP